MAGREKQSSSVLSLSVTSFLFLSLLCFSVLLLFPAFSVFQSSPTASTAAFSPPQAFEVKRSVSLKNPCDFADGEWVYDPEPKSGKRYDHTCKEIFKGWNCILNNKTNALEISKWRWKPRQCDLPVFDPIRFLERHRDTSIGFVGDSLNRNMFVSLFCTLKQKSNDIKKWRPAKADRGFTFLQYNLTIAYHRTNLLARYGSWSANPKGGVLESLGYKEGYRVDVDVPDTTWANAPGFHDVIIFNTGHWWWAPAKFNPVKSPMLFFNNGVPIVPPLSPDLGLDLVLKHMILYVDNRMRPGGIKIFRTQSPRHFEGGEWNEGGSCKQLQPLGIEQVEELFSVKGNSMNVEVRLVNQHLDKALGGSGFHILNITKMSEFRADAHPAGAGGKKHDDCMHWCLPGLTDTWNDLFVALLGNIQDPN